MGSIRGTRKGKYRPQRFETPNISGKDTSANIYMEMMTSTAFRDLTKNQQDLYMFIKAQYYGQKHKPEKDFKDVEAVQGNDKFYFNLALAEYYGLYSAGNKRAFYNDMKALEEHGFIETVANGKATHSKSIYRYSAKWIDWTNTS